MSERADWRHNEITNKINKGGPATETLSQARNVWLLKLQQLVSSVTSHRRDAGVQQ